MVDNILVHTKTSLNRLFKEEKEYLPHFQLPKAIILQYIFKVDSSIPSEDSVRVSSFPDLLKFYFITAL